MGSKASYGTVEFSLGDKDYTLTVNLKAMDKIERTYNGAVGALEAVGRMDSRAMARVIAAGAGLGESSIEDIRENILANGMVKAVGPVTQFLGKILDPTGEAQEQFEKGESSGED